MTDERFEEFIQREAKSYNEPSPTPREEIWSRIAATRATAKPTGSRSTGWMSVAVGVAAVLIVGIGIGRWSVATPGGDVDVVASDLAEADEMRIYRVAAMDHLGQLDVFIGLFRADAEAGRTDPTTGTWARDLMMTTRLMLDSPAGDDPGLRELLEDLEFVLAQITQYVSAGDEADLELIQEDLNNEGVLLRLQAELAVSSADLPAQGEI